MPRRGVIAALALLMPIWGFSTTLARATEDSPSKRGAMESLDNEEQMIPPADDSQGVITPPPIGDEGIYKEAPNPKAGHDEEVIPPSDMPDEDEVIETNTSSS
jgi:hypothetical protein